MYSFEILTYTHTESYLPAVKIHITKHYNIKSIFPCSCHVCILHMFLCNKLNYNVHIYVECYIYIYKTCIFAMCVYTHIYVSVCIYGGGTEIEKEVIYLCNKYFCRIVKNTLYKCFSIRYYMVTLSVVEEGTLYFRVVYKMSSYATV